MRQIVSLIKDDQAHFAYTDGDDLVQFAQLLVPDPMRFGLHEAALVGTNLVELLGLNGHKRATVKVPPPLPSSTVRPALNPGIQPSLLDEDPDVGAVEAKRKETPRERRNRIARETYHRNKALGMTTEEAIKARSVSDKPKRGRPPGGITPGRRYISWEEVAAVIERHPEGVSCSAIGREIMGTDEPMDWVTKHVANRIQDKRSRGMFPYAIHPVPGNGAQVRNLYAPREG